MHSFFANESVSATQVPPARERHGFSRTVCGCEFCRIPCRHIPGGLDVSDLEQLCPAGQDVFAWAEQHLRALTHNPFPTLVPARQGNGHCHWFFEGKCAVHANAPYGCAFFDSHMPEAEVQRRSAATIQARIEDAAGNGLYYRVWMHLCRKGLVGSVGERGAVLEEMRAVQRRAEGRRRRSYLRGRRNQQDFRRLPHR